ncbi:MULTISPECIES: hypothetical protein [Mycobacterium]|uniref:Uncharacterized protein n=1 Tax=Mycobacterium kiyosense TaxID=2871094 RepID=A0A9P3UWR0_9MYCO|nr:MULTISPECIES: hypothetical protein [Mycobacterium]BDB42838.1 hypothetical protein IWGMT90018_32840 [Mycobacterium kiyosense]BDE13923.1 hypothetical protein MKCMC460_27830 [Mycobacterium sp. 20KCMC460]GLB84625.1 hypothetical protein SRL2020028_38810 [Mycobacterium kiyosense]GLB91924.1 hypothetical protein SRL2020130_47410 [Mycobacterium kiyosense]GLB97973.1 hypothetical protein SRL2020226_47490 [Mycobacterium kiyosense]
MIDDTEWRAAVAELTEWDHAATDDPRTYADLHSLNGIRTP